VDLWRRAAASARTIVDVGANSGLFAIVAKVVNPAATVIAFEPMPLFADALRRNVAHNGIDVRVVRAAVSNAEGQAQFFVPDELAGNIYSSSLSREHYDRHQTSAAHVLDVDVVTFDAFAAREGVRGVDLLKIDAEGHDVMVLEGMADTLARDVPDCLIEIQSDKEGAGMMPFFDPARYAYYNLSETSGPLRAKRLGRSETVNFFVCKHETARALGLPGAGALG
jgi:FkbM family methyltransferase